MANSKMNQTLKEIIRTREDISDYVFHFTKGSKAKRILEAIVSDRAIKDVKRNGYICFTEAPITMLPTMFDIFRKYDEPMFAPYGIGIKKNVFYNMLIFRQMQMFLFGWKIRSFYLRNEQFLQRVQSDAGNLAFSADRPCHILRDTKKSLGQMPHIGLVLTSLPSYLHHKYRQLQWDYSYGYVLRYVQKLFE